jgi:spermidine synthase
LIHFFDVFQILGLNILVGWLVVYLKFESNNSHAYKIGSLLFNETLFSIAFIVLLGISVQQQLTYLKWHALNPQLTFKATHDTPYQTLTALALDNQTTIYSNDKPVYHLPDRQSAEQLIHSIMPQVSRPDSILLVSGGFTGILPELLKYQVERIDYCEKNPHLLEFVRPYMAPNDKDALIQPRIKIHHADGRSFIRRSKRRYDLILVQTSEPATLTANRFFTLEFFSDCYEKLTQEGILCIMFPSSDHYLDEHLLKLDASIYHTFKQVFGNTLLIPGTTAILLGKKSTDPFIEDPKTLKTRFKDREIKTGFFSPEFYEFIYQPDKIEQLTAVLESHTEKLNRDDHPVALLYTMMVWNNFMKTDNSPFIWLAQNPYGLFLGFFVGFLCLGLHRKNKVLRFSLLRIVMFTVGFVGMFIPVVILMRFQIQSGELFHQMGVLLASEMLGLAIGTRMVTLLKYKPEKSLNYLFGLMVLFIFLMPVLPNIRITYLVFYIILMIVVGLLCGALFSVLNRIYLANQAQLPSLYAVDVLGGGLGALLAASFLLPILGVSQSCFFMGGVGLILLILVYTNVFVSRHF